MAKQKFRLKKATIESLFEMETVKVGDEDVSIRALSVGELAEFTRHIEELFQLAVKEEINFSDLTAGSGESMAKLLHLIVTQTPHIVSDLSGIEEESLVELPIGTGIEILDACIRINTKNVDKLKANFASLATSFSNFTGGERKPTKLQEAVQEAVTKRTKEDEEFEKSKDFIESLPDGDPAKQNEFPHKPGGKFGKKATNS